MKDEEYGVCIICGSPRDLRFIAVPNEKGSMVGMVFACPSHFMNLANGNNIIWKDTEEL